MLHNSWWVLLNIFIFSFNFDFFYINFHVAESAAQESSDRSCLSGIDPRKEKRRLHKPYKIDLTSVRPITFFFRAVLFYHVRISSSLRIDTCMRKLCISQIQERFPPPPGKTLNFPLCCQCYGQMPHRLKLYKGSISHTLIVSVD